MKSGLASHGTPMELSELQQVVAEGFHGVIRFFSPFDSDRSRSHLGVALLRRCEGAEGLWLSRFSAFGIASWPKPPSSV